MRRQVKMREKRKHTRHELIYRVALHPEGGTATPIETESFNISFGGMGIILKNYIKNTENIDLSIHDPQSEELIRARGRIVWQSGSPGLGAQRAGIQFTEIPWTQLKSLLACHQL